MGQLLVHPVALLSFFIPRVFMLFCLISLHYVNGINKVMMMMTSFPIYRYHYMNRSDNIEQTRLTAFPDMLAMSRSWLKTPTTVSLAGTNIVCCLDRLDCHTQQQTRWVATSTASSTLSPTDDKQLRIKVNTKLLISIVLSSNRMWNNTTFDLAQNRPLWRMMSTYGATQSWVACQKRRRRSNQLLAIK